MLLTSLDTVALSPVMQEIVDVAGSAGTLALIDHYGGAVLQVPAQYCDDHILTRIMGHQAAAAFIQHFAGTRVYIAKLEDYAIRLQRDITIASKYDSGIPVNKLAREYKLSARQIWNILKRPETLINDQQIDLFSSGE